MSLLLIIVLTPLVQGFQVCRKVFILALGFVSWGVAASISISVTVAYVGHVLFGFTVGMFSATLFQ